MMAKSMTKVAVAATAMLAATALATPAAAADWSKVRFELHRATRTAVDLGVPGPSTADIASSNGKVKALGKGANGSYTWLGTTLDVDATSGTETRQSSLVLTFKKGAIHLQALHSAPAGAVPVKPFEYVIVGGTGAYMGIRGEATYRPLATPGDARVILHYALD